MLGILLERFSPDLQYLFIAITVLIYIYQFYVDLVTEKLYMSYSFYAGGLIMLVFFNIGYLRSHYNNPSLDKSHYMHYADQYTHGIGVVQEVPIKRTSYRTEVEMEYLCDDNNNCIKVNHKAIIYFKKDDIKASLYKPGDKIAFKSKLSLVGRTTNPYSFDFQNYLWNRGITHQTYIWNSQCHYLLSENNLVFYMQLAMNSRNAFLKIFDKYITDPDQNSIVSAMVLGYRNTVSEEMYKAFSDSGSVHILAVSGMHLVFLSSLLSIFFGKMKFISKELKLVMTIFILWFFSLITGAAPAVIRAAIMFTFILYGRDKKLFTNMYNILAFCALIMLIYDPFLLFQASFQFSFLALLSLAYFQPYVQPWLSFENKYIFKIWEYFSATIAAQILVVPITIFFFHKFPTYFMLSGFLPVLLSNYVMYIAIGLVVIEYLPFLNFVNLAVAPLLKLNLILFIWSVASIKELPFSSIDGLTLSTFEFVMMGGFLILLMYFMIDRNARVVYAMFSTVFLLLFSLGFRIHNANHQSLVTVYDVNKSGLVDFFDGTKVYKLGFDSLATNQLSFINQNNRFYHFSREFYSIDLKENFKHNRIQKVDNILQLKNKKFAILYEQEQLCRDYSNCDYILLMRNLEFESCFKIQKNQTLICDKSLKYNNLKAWKENFNNEDNIFKDIRETGAITIDI